MTTAALIGHLAAVGDGRVDTATFGVTALDSCEPSLTGMFASERTVGAAVRRSRDKGVVAGREMARLFSWLRANDLVWSYWVNNYLLGNDPPAFDVLFWNNDTTNLPAALHAEFLDVLLEDTLSQPGGLEVLGTSLDLGKVTCDAYVVAGDTDHITPWRACYRTTQILGGRSEFVLSNSGHVQSPVNPPGHPKARYQTGGEPGADPDEWLAGSTAVEGSWWAHWSRWITTRSGESRVAPKELGNRRHKPVGAAPGRYVHQR